MPRACGKCSSIARYRERGLTLYFRGDAAFAKPEVYELLEAEGIGYTIRLPTNSACIADRAPADAANAPTAQEAAGVLCELRLPSQSWTKPRRVVAKVEWHQGSIRVSASSSPSSGGRPSVAQWTLTTLREKLVKIGARVARPGRYHVFQLAEVAVPRALFAGILRRIERL